MASLDLSCPLMVVKGDGSLLHVDYARTRPVETILSGPAASLAGAAFLAEKKAALVADIGGTTTDIARLQQGVALLSHEGAHIGGWRTMVEAAHIRTRGLGGDSEIRADNRAMTPSLLLGAKTGNTAYACWQPKIQKLKNSWQCSWNSLLPSRMMVAL